MRRNWRILASNDRASTASSGSRNLQPDRPPRIPAKFVNPSHARRVRHSRQMEPDGGDDSDAFLRHPCWPRGPFEVTPKAATTFRRIAWYDLCVPERSQIGTIFRSQTRELQEAAIGIFAYSLSSGLPEKLGGPFCRQRHFGAGRKQCDRFGSQRKRRMPARVRRVHCPWDSRAAVRVAASPLPPIIRASCSRTGQTKRFLTFSYLWTCRFEAGDCLSNGLVAAAAATRPASGTPEVPGSRQTVCQLGARSRCHSSRTVDRAASRIRGW